MGRDPQTTPGDNDTLAQQGSSRSEGIVGRASFHALLAGNVEAAATAHWVWGCATWRNREKAEQCRSRALREQSQTWAFRSLGGQGGGRPLRGCVKKSGLGSGSVPPM